MDATISDTSTDKNGYSDTSMCIADDKWMAKVAGFKTELANIMDDLTDCIANDHTIISGVSKCIKAYHGMRKSHAPNTSILYVLHNFGKSDIKSFVDFSIALKNNI